MATNVQMWAVEELSNRGVRQLLPEMIKSIRSWYSSQLGDELVWLCTTKIDLLSTSQDRLEALTRALAMDDTTSRQGLKRWAVDELCGLQTEAAKSALIGYAIALQEKYHDKLGKPIVNPNDHFSGYAVSFYRTIVKNLRDRGMTETAIRQTGVRPDRFFVGVR